MEPQILFEDNDILVINKPAGMTVNKADTTTGEKTLQDWVEEKLKIKSSKFKIENTYDAQEVFSSRAGIVHRLDKETSGVILVAKNVESFQNLQAQFKDRTVKKMYMALSHGKVENAEGEINAPVGRLPWNRKRFGVLAEGREALTRYRAISNFQIPISNEQLTLLELFPETGRTHQIRVHLKHMNHPIFGDFLYAGRKTARDDRKVLPRVFLHASKITFRHPKTDQPMAIDASLPEELDQFLKSLIRYV